MGNITYTFGSTFSTHVTHDQNTLTQGDLHTTLNNHHDVYQTPSFQSGSPAELQLVDMDNETYTQSSVTWQVLQPAHVTQQLLESPVSLYPDTHDSQATQYTIIDPGTWLTIHQSIQLVGEMDSNIDTHNPVYRMRLGTTSNCTLSSVTFNIMLNTGVIGAPTVTSVMDTTQAVVTMQVNDNTQTTMEQMWNATTQAYYSQGVDKQWTFHVGQLSYTY